MTELLTGRGKWGLRIAFHVAFGELEHESIDLLRLSGQTERLQEEPKRVYESRIPEVQKVDERLHSRDVRFLSVVSSAHSTSVFVKIVPFAKVFAHHGLAQAVRLQKEGSNLLRLLALDEARLEEEFDALNMRPFSRSEANHD
jgi:hypothetical protein